MVSIPCALTHRRGRFLLESGDLRLTNNNLQFGYPLICHLLVCDTSAEFTVLLNGAEGLSPAEVLSTNLLICGSDYFDLSDH